MSKLFAASALGVALLSLVLVWGQLAQAQEYPPPYRDAALNNSKQVAQDEPPAPLPRGCDGVTPPGGSTPTCCVYGYIYHNGVPVAGASIRIEGPYGVLTTTTTGGGASGQPYYQADLSSSPISATTGTVITITASYSDTVSARTWVVQSLGQHVDLGLIAGYRAPRSVSIMTADALFRATQAVTRMVSVPPSAAGQDFTGILQTTGPGTWTIKSPIPAPRDSAAAVALDGKVYLIGGSNSTGALSSTLTYDPVADTWSSKANMPGVKSGPGAAVVNGHIYVVGPPDSQVYEYNPDTNSWAIKSSLPVTPADKVALAAISGQIFAVFPVAGNAHPQLYRYDPFQDTWEQRQSHSDERTIASLGIANGMIYAVGGCLIGQSPCEPTRVDRYDPMNDAWTTNAISPTTTRHTHLGPTLSTVGGKMYVIGGWDGYSELASVEVYDPWSNTWASETPMSTARYKAAFAMVGYKVYVMGGNRGGVSTNWLTATEELALPEPAQPENAIAFVSGRDGYYEIYTMKPDGSHQTRITNDGCANWHVNWRPNSARLLFSADCTGSFDIYSMNPDGSDWRRISALLGNEWRPSISPDGRTIAFGWNPPSSSDWHIYLMNSDGTNIRQLTSGAGTENDSELAWSPDSQSIVFRSTRDCMGLDPCYGNGKWQLWRINVDGSGLTQLTNLPGEAHDPAWSPDGSTIAFTSEGDLRLMDPDGTNIRTLSGPGWEERPAWSPDGTRLAYNSWRGSGQGEIYSKKTDNTDEWNLTNNTAYDSDPAWARFPIFAAFGGAPLAGPVPLETKFTDWSTGDIIAWTWTFGDGGISGARHPSHLFESVGVYTVSLAISGPRGSDTETKANYITVTSLAGEPVCNIKDINPNPATQYPTQTVIFNSDCHDTDEGGAYMVTYRWRSSIDGLLSTAEDFSIPARELSIGSHTIYLQGQDNEGVWSREVTRTLTVQPNPHQDVRMLILVNRQKLVSLYSDSEATQVIDKLNALAAHNNVKGAVVQVENDAAVAAAYTAWDAVPTSTSRVNAVTTAIKDVIAAQWTAYPNLEYLVIVGDDRAIPFRRVRDQTGYPEGNYEYVSTGSTTGAALRDNMTLTDDYYADKMPTVPSSPGWDGHELYIPDLGIGRLIETPSEIVAQIDAFLSSDGIAAGNAIVTGYDFVKDGAQAMCSALSGDGITTDCTLTGDSWNADQFRANVLNTRHDIVSINGHANHYTIGTPSGSISSSDVAGATTNHTRALFYALGCHSGLNVPPNNPYQPLDIAQAMAQQKVVYIANTGYGWGYRTSVGLSEQLMLDFTEQMVYGQSTTAGQALAAAKQEYYLNEGGFDYYGEKVMIESTLYGLPMYRYSTPTGTAMQRQVQAQGQGATAVKSEQTTMLGDGLTVNTISYQFPALLAKNTEDGVYYSFGGLTQGGDGETIQPKYTTDLSFPQTKAHGVVFKGGIYTDVTSFNPVVDRAITETAAVAEPMFDKPGWYPSVTQRLNRLERGDKLVMSLGQFHSQSQVERVYDQLSFDIYYHTTSTDWTPPTIKNMSSGLGTGNVIISIAAEDSSDIETVVIAYTDGNGIWSSASLAKSGDKWSGTFPATTSKFFIQVVDKAGNVAVRDDAGQYYTPGDKLLSMVYLPLVLSNR